MDRALGPIEIADMRDRARQVLHEADDAEAEAGAYLIRSGGGGDLPPVLRRADGAGRHPHGKRPGHLVRGASVCDGAQVAA